MLRCYAERGDWVLWFQVIAMIDRWTAMRSQQVPVRVNRAGAVLQPSPIHSQYCRLIRNVPVRATQPSYGRPSVAHVLTIRRSPSTIRTQQHTAKYIQCILHVQTDYRIFYNGHMTTSTSQYSCTLSSFVSRIQYWLLVGAPKTSTDKLQRVMIAAARILSNTWKSGAAST